jgi:hypothetical protein
MLRSPFSVQILHRQGRTFHLRNDPLPPAYLDELTLRRHRNGRDVRINSYRGGGNLLHGAGLGIAG